MVANQRERDTINKRRGTIKVTADEIREDGVQEKSIKGELDYI